MPLEPALAPRTGTIGPESTSGVPSQVGGHSRALLEAGRPLTSVLPLRLALELKAIIAGGLRVLDRIDARKGDVFRAPLRLTAHDWVAVAFRALVPRRASSRPASA